MSVAWLQVDAYMFGSVPLRTYLPDGDIDLSVVCSQEVAQSMRDTWALKLQSVIEQEQSSGSAPFRIGDVTVINAEVRGIKTVVGVVRVAACSSCKSIAVGSVWQQPDAPVYSSRVVPSQSQPCNAMHW